MNIVRLIIIKIPIIMASVADTTSMRKRPIIIGVGGVSFVLLGEIITKRYAVTRPSQLIHTTGMQLARAARWTGSTVAKLSDIVGMIRFITRRMWAIVKPYLTEIITAACEICNELGTLMISPLSGFISGYEKSLISVYNRTATIATSVMFGVGGAAVLLLTCECMGLAFKRDNLRPSTYMKRFATYLYNNSEFISRSYLRMCDFVGHMKRVYETFRVYLEPLVKQINVASNYLMIEGKHVVVSPFNGAMSGINKALAVAKDNVGRRNVMVLSALALTGTICGVAMKWKFK